MSFYALFFVLLVMPALQAWQTDPCLSSKPAYPALALQAPSQSNSTAPGLTYKVIPAANNSFGYDIFDGRHRLIHQTSIPGIPGNKGFVRKKDAEKVALLVIEKLNKKIMPPSITIREMDSLKIKY